MTEIPYVLREDIMSTLDVKPSAYMERQIDRACMTGSRLADGFCHRTFAPVLDTKTFDYPGPRATSRRIWFDEHGLISATAVTSDGVSMTENTDYFLRPENSQDRPFDYIELNRNSSASFSGGPQRAVSIEGLWGYNLIETSDMVLESAISTSVIGLLSVTAPAGVGVGSLLRIDAERMLVIGFTWVNSTVTASALTASNASNLITVADASLFTPHEKLLIDGERMEVLDTAGTVLTVRRAVDGTVLAAHSGATAIYWAHNVAVRRGVCGTSAATHADGSTVYRWEPPSQIATLSRAYAIDTFLQENAGYARTAGQGENERPASGRGIKDLEARCRPFIRSARKRAV